MTIAAALTTGDTLDSTRHDLRGRTVASVALRGAFAYVAFTDGGAVALPRAKRLTLR